MQGLFSELYLNHKKKKDPHGNSNYFFARARSASLAQAR